MSILIPEHGLVQGLIDIIAYVKADLDANSGDETKSMLYRMFGGVVFENLDYYEQIKKIITDSQKTQKEKRKLKITMGYDFNNNQYPTIAVILPMEQDSPINNTFAGGEDIRDDVDGSLTEQNQQNYSTEYGYLIISDNPNEVILLYHFVKACLVGFVDTFQQKYHFENIRTSGKDYISRMDIPIPPNAFARVISMHFHYTMETPVPGSITKADGFISDGEMYDDTLGIESNP